MTLEDLRQAGGEGGAGEHHVGAGFLRLLLEFGLDVGDEADDADAFGGSGALEPGDEPDGLDPVVVEIEDDKQGLLQFGLFDDVVFRLEKFDFEAGAPGEVVDLHDEKEVFDRGKDFLAFGHTGLADYLNGNCASDPWLRRKGVPPGLVDSFAALAGTHRILVWRAAAQAARAW